jgi:catechol 2,3-dioxygenase-like lactoylglutathione lyase family enzyme
MNITGFHHVGLYVKDSERSRLFYEKLGGTVIHNFLSKSTGKNVYLVDLGGAVLEIIPKGTGERETNPHWVHVTFRTEDPALEYRMAIDAGAASIQEPKEITLGSMKAFNSFVTGPDGEVIEFFKEYKVE